MHPQAQGNPVMGLVPIIAVFLIFYWLLIRPQQKQAKAREKMLAALKKGDRLMTTGGLYGTILGIRGDDLEVRFAENVKLTLHRSAVARLITSAVSASESGSAALDGAPSEKSPA